MQYVPARAKSEHVDKRYLTKLEMEKLLAVTRGDRQEARDYCLLLLMYRHGLRVSELCGLQMGDVDVDSRALYVRRSKRGLSTTQPLHDDELRAIAAWLRERKRLELAGTAFFQSDQRRAMHRATVNLLLDKYSAAAGFTVRVHPHMLRHACGYALANRGADTRLIQDYLGHRSIQSTVRYTATNPARFEALWR